MLIVAATLLSGCYDSFKGGGSSDDGELPTPNITIKSLVGMLESDRLLIYDDIIIQGRVTSTDENGNFYKTFFVENNGYAVEILEGLYNSYVRHDVGSTVSVKLQGLALSAYQGVVQVGLASSQGDYYMLDYIGSEVLVDEYISCDLSYNPIEPYAVGYDDLSEDICGRLIRLDNLTHTPAEDQLQPYTWEGYQQFVDNLGRSIYCYTSEYANFSLTAIPSGTLSLCGILYLNSIYGVSGGEQFILQMRGAEDCISE